MAGTQTRKRCLRRLTRLVAAAFTVVLVASIGGARAATPTYTMIDLGTLPGGSGGWARAVNGSGQVVGHTTAADGADHAFLWTQSGGMVDLGALLPTGHSWPTDINAGGQVVGTYNTALGNRMFSWTQADGMLDIGSLGGSINNLTDVNDAGDVVGTSQTSAGVMHAFRWSRAGGLTDLGTLGGAFASASAINSAGDVVGSSSLASGEGRATLWKTDGSVQNLGTLGGPGSWATGISDAGHVVGASTTSSGGFAPHAFVWTAETGMVDLGALAPAGYSSAGVAVNPAGEVLISAYSADGTSRAYVWTRDGGIVDLGTLGGRSTSLGSRPLNDRGEVVGYSATPAGPMHAFVWTRRAGMVDLGPMVAFGVGPQGWVVGTSGRPTLWIPNDDVPPTLSVPTDIVVDATSPTGAEVSFDVSVTDDADPEPVVSCTPASGSWFGLGDTTVTCTATDASGNTASATFAVHVRSALEQLVGAGDDLEGLALTGRQANVRRDSALAFLDVASEPLRWTIDGGQPRTSDEGRYALLRIRQTVQYLRTPDAELAGASVSIRQRLIGLVGMVARSRYDEVSSTPGASTSRLAQAWTSLEQAAEQPGTIDALYDYVNAWTVLRAEAPQH